MRTLKLATILMCTFVIGCAGQNAAVPDAGNGGTGGGNGGGSVDGPGGNAGGGGTDAVVPDGAGGGGGVMPGDMPEVCTDEPCFASVIGECGQVANSGKKKVCRKNSVVVSEGACVGARTPGMVADSCNGKDDDCDGSINTGCGCDPSKEPTRECGSDTGDCHKGKETCVKKSDGKWDFDGICKGAVTPKPAEICDKDGHDENCNGSSNEGFDLMNDPTNCGACGNVCAFRSGFGSCVAGVCKLTGCLPGFYDYNKNPSDGCEGACAYLTPLATELCNGIDDTCDNKVDEGFNLDTDVANCGKCGRACAFTHATGVCSSGDCMLGACASGYRDVNKDPSDGCEQKCDVWPTTAEVPGNKLDDNCDGNVDEGTTCDPASPPVLCGNYEGECKTHMNCQVTGPTSQFSTCVVDQGPVPEICNGKDDDCDGVKDNGIDKNTDPNNCGACGNKCTFLNATATCVAGLCKIGTCNAGKWDANGSTADGCEYPPGVNICALTHAGVEQCDGIDNDCNAKTDEGASCTCIPGTEAKDCGSNVGACKFGKSACIGYGTRDVCDMTVPGAVTPTTEKCNGVDDDCNGVIDDLPGGLTTANDPKNCGVCNHVCAFDHAAVSCVAGVCAMGACDQNWYDIDGKPGNGCEKPCVKTTPSTEVCDGQDNDCNGLIDDGAGACMCSPVGSTNFCGSSDGLCKPGIQTCLFPGTPGVCGSTPGIVYVPPALEVCNGVDDNCNTFVDEGYMLSSDAFNCGRCNNVCSFPHAIAGCSGGACVMGACNTNWYDIDGFSSNGCEKPCIVSNGGVEKCDTFDNDCNGQTDETFNLQTDVNHCNSCDIACTFLNAAASCVKGSCVQGACNVGGYYDLNPAVPGCEYKCSVNPKLATDICGNGLDDDCNGLIDDACPCDKNDLTPRLCGNNTGPCKAQWVCQANGTQGPCVVVVGPVAETCDGKDNDCDGAIDNGFNFTNDKNNCGGCGTVCSFPHAAASCVASTCTMGACDPQYSNFTAAPGCEYGPCVPGGDPVGVEVCDNYDNDCNGSTDELTNKLTDPNNCGSCGKKCALPNTLVNGCTAGVCTVTTCNNGWSIFPGHPELGCVYGCTKTVPATEVCDGLDNDCNGVFDDVGGVVGSCPPPPPSGPRSLTCVVDSGGNTVTLVLTGTLSQGQNGPFPVPLPTMVGIDVGQTFDSCYLPLVNSIDCNRVPYVNDSTTVVIPGVPRYSVGSTLNNISLRADYSNGDKHYYQQWTGWNVVGCVPNPANCTPPSVGCEFILP